MIVLDTNVLSEPLRARPSAEVLAWLESQTETLALTAISVGELLTVVRLLSPGRRRAGLEAAIEVVLAAHADRVLPYDEPAARHYSRIMESRRTSGHPMSVEDGMIAAICLARGAGLATRNLKDFDGLGLEVIDPWDVRSADFPPRR